MPASLAKLLPLFALACASGAEAIALSANKAPMRPANSVARKALADLQLRPSGLNPVSTRDVAARGVRAERLQSLARKYLVPGWEAKFARRAGTEDGRRGSSAKENGAENAANPAQENGAENAANSAKENGAENAAHPNVPAPGGSRAPPAVPREEQVNKAEAAQAHIARLRTAKRQETEGASAVAGSGQESLPHKAPAAAPRNAGPPAGEAGAGTGCKGRPPLNPLKKQCSSAEREGLEIAVATEAENALNEKLMHAGEAVHAINKMHRIGKKAVAQNATSPLLKSRFATLSKAKQEAEAALAQQLAAAGRKAPKQAPTAASEAAEKTGRRLGGFWKACRQLGEITKNKSTLQHTATAMRADGKVEFLNTVAEESFAPRDALGNVRVMRFRRDRFGMLVPTTSLGEPDGAPVGSISWRVAAVEGRHGRRVNVAQAGLQPAQLSGLLVVSPQARLTAVRGSDADVGRYLSVEKQKQGANLLIETLRKQLGQ